MVEARRIRLLIIVLACGSVPGAPRASGASDVGFCPALRDGSTPVIVQLDVPARPEAALRSRAAVAAQRGAIAAAQGALERELGASDATTRRRYATIPFVALEVTAEGLAALERSPLVRHVERDRSMAPSLQFAAPRQGAVRAWEQGFDGTGRTVALLDTGVDGGHPFLAGKVIGEACFRFDGGCPNGGTTQIGEGAAAPCDYVNCDHGTHVAGIIAGRGDDRSGIARGASLLAIQVFVGAEETCGDLPRPCPQSCTSDQIAALEYVYQQRSVLAIDAVNLSLGGGRYSSQPPCDEENASLKAVIDNLRAAGIATVAGAGNESFTDALGFPACLSSTISVGAVTRADAVAHFSNSAPFLTLLAIGKWVDSAQAGGGFVERYGTSMSTPMVAAAFAVLRQKNRHASVEDLVAALVTTGVPIADPRNGIVKPRLQLDAALDAIREGPRAGVQITPDRRFHLVSKDVGDERWAITFEPATGYVTGNVFDARGGEPRFVSCAPLPPEAGEPETDVRFSCAAAVPCAEAPCDPSAWTFAGEPTLPRSFFDPPAAAVAAPLSAAGRAPAAP